MGKVSPKRRSMEIKQKKIRRMKLNKLRAAYKTATSQKDKDKIWEKVKKIAPWLKMEEFLLSNKNKKFETPLR